MYVSETLSPEVKMKVMYWNQFFVLEPDEALLSGTFGFFDERFFVFSLAECVFALFILSSVKDEVQFAEKIDQEELKRFLTQAQIH
jgi:hypothetical protein